MAARANPWNDFQHRYAGFALSREDFSRLYHFPFGRVRETLEKADPPVPVARIVQLFRKPVLPNSPCKLCKREDIRELSDGDNFCGLCGGRLQVPDPAEEVDTAEKVDEAGETGASSSRRMRRGRRKGKNRKKTDAAEEAAEQTLPTLRDPDAAEESGNTEEAITSSIGCPCADCLSGKPPRNPEKPDMVDDYVMELHKAYHGL